MSKVKIGNFGFRGVPHNVERKSYGQEGKELMSFRMHQKQYLKTFSTTTMEQIELAVTHGVPVWVFGEIVVEPGYGDNADKTYTNYTATAALLDVKELKAAPQGGADDLPF